MSYPRNMAGAVALLASSSLLGLGCAVATDGQDKDADEQSVVADNVTVDEQTQGDESALATDDGTGAATEATGESKDALWYGGYGYPGFGFRRFGFGYPGFGYGFRRFGYGYPGFGYGGFGYGYPGFGYGGFGYGYPGFGYGGCGFGC